VARRNLATAQHSLGTLYHDCFQADRAVESYRLALAQRERLQEEFPDEVEYRCDLAGTCDRLGHSLERLNQREEALAVFRRAIEHQRAAVTLAPDQPRHRRSLGDLQGKLAKRLRDWGRLSEAVELALQRRALWPADPAELYAVACELAECAGQEPTYTSRALEVLREAVVAGYTDLGRLRTEPALKGLRSHPAFQEIVDRPSRGSSTPSASRQDKP
jgi:tetratricopeptide (TPR) repeat protein